ncbi:hypothetical protein HK097_008316 [Rhizophlyctis rosea]|uniref:Uncharacterized protein n=1 Tax=Rhizophlyctis rosea TaxID=64517 RepID=A0AAD5X1S1_9FUNG|nr:hypothetical protein HK097_008316 [Rhizophlyctis rosea]
MATYLAYQHPAVPTSDFQSQQHHEKQYHHALFGQAGYAHPLNPVGLNGSLHPMGIAPAAVGAFGAVGGALVNGGSGCGSSGPRKRKNEDDHQPTGPHQPSVSPPRTKRLASSSLFTPSNQLTDPHHEASPLYLHLATTQAPSTIVQKPTPPSDSFPSTLASPWCMPVYNTQQQQQPTTVPPTTPEPPKFENIMGMTIIPKQGLSTESQPSVSAVPDDTAMMDVEQGDVSDGMSKGMGGFKSCMGGDMSQWVPSSCVGAGDEMRWGGARWEGC